MTEACSQELRASAEGVRCQLRLEYGQSATAEVLERKMAEGIAEAWNAGGIAYAVAHGLEAYPERLGRDLDVMMDQAHLPRAESIMRDAFRSEGWSAFKHVKPWATWVFGFKRLRDGFCSLEIDLVSRIQWGPATLVESGRSDAEVGPFRVDSWAHLAKTTMMAVLGGASASASSRLRSEGVSEVEVRASELRLREFFGRRTSQQLMQLFKNQEYDNLREMESRLRRSLLFRSITHRPWTTACTSLSWIRDKLTQWYAQPCAPMIALVGPDGVGKSSTIDRLDPNRIRPLTGLVVKHWRPGLLLPLRELFARRAATGQPDCAPRRNPGRLHLLRLAYYATDFIVGGFLKDRKFSSLLQLVVYDRCGLDMVVDPVRYGLRSTLGTRLVWKLTPKPDAVILLCDRPDRIAGRKQELPEDEIREQLTRWSSLAEQGKLDAVLDAAVKAETRSRCVRDILWDRFEDKNLPLTTAPPSRRETLHWLGSMLTVDPAVAEVDSSDGATGKGRAGPFKQVFSFSTVPGDRGARFVFTRSERGVSLRGLYNPQRRVAQWAARLASLALGCKAVQRRLPTELSVKVPTSCPSSQYGKMLLQSHLADVLGVPAVQLAISLGTPGVHRKPVLQILDGGGETVGYGKIGWNPQTISLVQTEERALKRLQKQPFTHAVVPRVLHSGAWNGLYLLLTEAADPVDVGPQEIGREHVEFLLELGGLGQAPEYLCGVDFVNSILHRTEELQRQGFTYYPHLIESTLRRLEFPGDRILACFKHGDFAPWNTLRSGKRLWVFDWEYAAGAAPAGWDLFHFLVQKNVLLRRAPFEVLWADLGMRSGFTAPSTTYFEQLGLSGRMTETLLVLYVADILSWSLLRDGDKVAAKDRRLRRVWGQLLGALSLRLVLRS